MGGDDFLNRENGCVVWRRRFAGGAGGRVADGRWQFLGNENKGHNRSLNYLIKNLVWRFFIDFK